MGRVLAVCAVALASLALPAIASAASQPSVHGHGSVMRGSDRFNISARGVIADADGQVRRTLTSFDPNLTGVGQVDCLNVQGNNFTASGLLKQSTFNFPGFPQTRFIAFGQDNGRGQGNQNPDRFGYLEFGSFFNFDCRGQRGPTGGNVTEGDIRIDPGG